MPDALPPRRWALPPDIHDPTRRRTDAQRRRRALEAAGCQTYVLGTRGGELAIRERTDLCCGLGSAHPGDIEEKFCGFCRTFHAAWREESG
jgi:hypothetical protein